MRPYAWKGELTLDFDEYTGFMIRPFLVSSGVVLNGARGFGEKETQPPSISSILLQIFKVFGRRTDLR